MSRAPPNFDRRDVQNMPMQQQQPMMMMPQQPMMMQQPMMQQQLPMMHQQLPMMQHQQPMMMQQQPTMQQPMMQLPMMAGANAMNVIDFKQDVVNGLNANSAASVAGMGSGMQNGMQTGYMPPTSFMANGMFMQPYQNFQQPMLELHQPVAAPVPSVGEKYGNDYYKTKSVGKKERNRQDTTNSKMASSYPTIPGAAPNTISRAMVANIVHTALRDSRLV